MDKTIIIVVISEALIIAEQIILHELLFKKYCKECQDHEVTKEKLKREIYGK